MVDMMHLEMMGDLLNELEKKDARGILSSKAFAKQTNKYFFQSIFPPSLPAEDERARLEQFSMFSGENERFAFRRAVSRMRDSYLQEPHHPHLSTIPTGESITKTGFQGRNRLAEDEGEGEGADFRPLRRVEVSDDFAHEADSTIWANDRKRRAWQSKQVLPKFQEQHFWGAGWWETIKQRIRPKK